MVSKETNNKRTYDLMDHLMVYLETIFEIASTVDICCKLECL